jgi:electron transfer flavoprotein alpha subunit
MPKVTNEERLNYQAIAVYAEVSENTLLSVGKELLSEARKLANKLGVEVHALLIGADVKPLADECFAFGADKAIVIEDPLLKDFSCEAYTKAAAAYIQKYLPQTMFVGATAFGRDLAARLAVRIDTGLTADSMVLDIEPETNLLQQTRPAFGGNIMATIVCPQHLPQLTTIRPNVLQIEPQPNAHGKTETLEVAFTPEDFRVSIKEVIAKTCQKVDLAKAEIIVAGGRGVKSAENFKLIHELAAALGGVVGATRPPVDANWISHEYQIGQTGQTVRPKIYFACGISGAIQHTIGVQAQDIIIAINNDPSAPIFKIANYGIVGDLVEVIPALIKELKN